MYKNIHLVLILIIFSFLTANKLYSSSFFLQNSSDSCASKIELNKVKDTCNQTYLKQMYMVPFGASYLLKFGLKERGNLEFILYDNNSNFICFLINDKFETGEYSINLIPLIFEENFKSGFYIIEMNFKSENNSNETFKDSTKFAIMK